MTDENPQSPDQGLISWLENMFAPEVYASDATVFSIGPSTATITLCSHRFDQSVQPAVQKRVVIGRVVLPIAAAQALSVALYDFLSKHGHAPMQRPTDPKDVQ
jgi:hypothetical protein